MARRQSLWPTLSVLAVVLAIAGCQDTDAGAENSAARVPSPAAGVTREAASPLPSPTADGLTSTGSVTDVVDGDTIKVDGKSVRLIGIDAPEVGQCGYDEATAAMAELVAGKSVTLTAVAGRDDSDQYGRLLRFVDVNGTDAGLREITLGLAVARYDGRDGYGVHPRQDPYVAADAAAADFTCAPAEPTSVPTAQAKPAPAPAAPVPAPVKHAPAKPAPAKPAPAKPAPTKPTPAPPTGPGTRAQCDPSYPTVCIPSPPPDLDCGDITFRNFPVLPPDPHRFDGDKDGIGCET